MLERINANSLFFQIEGGWDADGKSPSIWDHFSETPGNMDNDDNGKVACDSYHKWREDVGLIKAMGLGYYRFSISWSRILPEGKPLIICVAILQNWSYDCVRELVSLPAHSVLFAI